MPVPDTEAPALSLMGSDFEELEVFVDAYVEVRRGGSGSGGN